LKSKVISELELAVKHGDSENISQVIAMIKEKGTPIIDAIDEMASLVTFIYFGDRDTKNVAFILSGEGWNKIEDNKFRRIGDTDIFYKSYIFSNDLRFQYNFSVNDDCGNDDDKRWKKRIYDPYCHNKLELLNEDGNIDEIRGSYIVMKNAQELNYSKPKHISNKGTIEKHSFRSEILDNERNIYIYLPYGYSKYSTSYKTLVLTDGNDYINNLCAKNVLDNLINEGKIPPIVAIFVTQTTERDKELQCNDKFIRFLIEEVLSWARSNYNLSINPEDNIIGGLSFGGLSAMYSGLKHSNVFGNVLSQSGSFWWCSKSCDKIVEQFERINKLPIKIYMEVGELEAKDSIIGTNEQLRDILIEKGYDVKYSVFKAGHDYLLWGETLANGLIFLLKE
jgi:enterochelin esterase family protein